MVAMHHHEAHAETDAFFEELNADGQAFVDLFAAQFEAALRKRNERVRFGMYSARHLAIVALMKYWTGELPEGWKKS